MRNKTEVIIDLGKELSLLNSYLEETWTAEVRLLHRLRKITRGSKQVFENASG